MKRYFPVITILLLFVSLSFSSGCQFKGGKSAYGLPSGKLGVSKNIWLPTVNAVAIYPSTSAVRTSSGPKLKATVQLVDVMGDCIKAPGSLRLELYKISNSSNLDGFLTPGSKLDKWTASLNTLKDQEKYYSPITRGYLLTLSLSSAYALDNSVLLRVTFINPNGKRIKVQRKLPIN